MKVIDGDKGVYTLPIEKDKDGELIITFPDSLMDSLNWQPGDTVQWIDNKDGTWSIKKLV